MGFRSRLIGGFLAFFGFVILNGGYSIVRLWPRIRLIYAACGILWLAAGAAMILTGLWLLAAGRRSVALRAGGVAAVLAGGSLVAGILTYVIPCSGPS